MQYSRPGAQAFQFTSLAVGAKSRPSPGKAGKPLQCDPNNRYVVKVPRQAYWTVLLRGCCAPDAGDDLSVIGKYGHLERSSAWTHLVAAFVFLIFAFIRPWTLGASTLSAQLSGVSIVFTAGTFAVSTVYHTYATVPRWGVPMRTLDHASIAVSLAAANVADLSMVTRNFSNVPIQTVIDPILASIVLVVYFGARRWYVPIEETKELQYQGKGCSLGLFRTFHSDLEHAALRASSTATLTLAWFLAIPIAWQTLELTAAMIWLAGAFFGTALLVGGVVLDNMTPIDDYIMRTGNAVFGPCNCSSKSLGCVVNSHALWHVIAIVAAAVAIAAREYGISTL